MARLLAGIGALFALLCVARPAAAAMMLHHDLTSLALQADAIVRGRLVGERRENAWTTWKTVVVDRNFKGPLAVGEKFEVSFDLYAMEPWHELFAEGPDAGKRVLGADFVFFLTRADGSRRTTDGGDARSAWWPVSSGVRIFLDGKAHRFEQWNNPGGFVPVPQGQDPFDLYGDPRGATPLDAVGLDAAVAAAADRAAAVAADLSGPLDDGRRRRLMAVLEEAPDVANTSLGGFYENTVARRVVDALAQTGDLTLTLRALARAPGVAPFYVRHGFRAPALFAAAANEALPLGSRLAALRLLASGRLDGTHSPELLSRLERVLTDREPRLRAAGAEVAARSEHAAVKALVVRRFSEEVDESVRLALFHAASALEVIPELRSPAQKLPLVAPALRSDVLSIAWADLDRRANWMVDEASRIVLTRGGTKESVPVDSATVGYTNGAVGHWTARLHTPAATAAELRLVLVDLGPANRGRRVERTFSLGAYAPPLAMSAAPSLAPVPTSEDGGASARRDAAASNDAGPVGDVPSPATARRGACACELAQGRAGRHGDASLALPVIAIAAALVRRRTRTPEHSARTGPSGS